eukprot:m.38729 g.38729  ORF g.38729 m.38729 type:complete len:533 (-) comp18000_c0_seq2:246-1844(-)
MPKKKKSGKKKSSKKSSKDGVTSKTSKVQTAEEKLWARRYKISEESRKVHRGNATTLVMENDKLQNSLQSAERDAIEVMNHFKNEIAVQVQENAKLDQTFAGFRRETAQESNSIITRYDKEVTRLNGIVEAQKRRIKKVEGELESLKEWQLAKDDLRKELDLLKFDNDSAKRDYEAFLEKREEKYFEEKVRARNETDAEMARLAETAQASAVSELDETTKKVYKDNVTLSTELSINKKEIDRLEKANSVLTERLRKAENGKEEDKLLVRSSVIKTKRHEKEMAALRDRAETLETALSHCVREFEHERALIVVRSEEASSETRAQLTSCQRALKLKTAENKRIRHLAKYVVTQRSELELFFHEALNSVRREIASSRALFEKEVKGKQNRQMLEGLKTGFLPPIRTFNGSDTSTNSMNQIFEEASVMPDLSTGVDIEDLSWEQKEQVLRRLFAKMNAVTSTAPHSHSNTHPHTQGLTSSSSSHDVRTLKPNPNTSNGHTHTGDVPSTINEGRVEEEERASFFITEQDPTTSIVT